MQIILLEKVVNLGDLGEIVKVKDGYARNFLIPDGRARRATEANKAAFEARRAELEKVAAAKLAEVRALIDEDGVLKEDPVTGSANACLARVLKEAGFPDGNNTDQKYLVRQGTKLQRDGRVTVTFIDGEPWIGGDSCTLIDGTLDL